MVWLCSGVHAHRPRLTAAHPSIHLSTLLQQRCFTVPGSDGKEVDLVPGASEAKVTFDNKDTWAQLAMDYRLHEFDRQVRPDHAIVDRGTLAAYTAPRGLA